jgi:phenylacetic acid degradation protein
MLATGSPATVRRELTAEELAWKANGTRTYHQLTERSRATMREVAPLSAVEPGRPSLPTDSSVAVPLDDYRRG